MLSDENEVHGKHYQHEQLRHGNMFHSAFERLYNKMLFSSANIVIHYWSHIHNVCVYTYTHMYIHIFDKYSKYWVSNYNIK